MKLWLGLVVLLGLFTGALLFQQHTLLASRASDEEREVRASSARVPDGQNWVRVVIGNPSDSPPFAASEPGIGASPVGTSAPMHEHTGATTKAPTSPTPEPRSFRLVVQRGQTLSEICRGHYGTARKQIVDAVARHNRIARIEQIREGETLELPPLEQLGDR